MSTDFEGFRDDPAAMPPIDVSIRVSADDVGAWKAAYEGLKIQLWSIARGPNDGLHVFVEVMVVHRGINGVNPTFRGVRVGPLSRKRGVLKLAVVVPEGATGPAGQLLREARTQGVDEAERFAERKGLAGELAGARRALRELPSPGAGETPTAKDAPLEPPRFTVGFRGYDTGQVSLIVSQGNEALRLESRAFKAQVLDSIRGRRLRTRLGGYDRQQVDGYLKLLEEALHRDPR